jgi:hypothetical protein
VGFSVKFSEISPFSFTEKAALIAGIREGILPDFFRFEISGEDALPMCGMIRLMKANNKLLVLFNGAVNREKHGFESYQRWSWIANLPYNVLILPDNTLSQGEFPLGWGIGSPESWFIESAAEFINQLADTISIELENTVLYGSSAGGFQAFQCGIQLKKPTVIMENPQTDIFRYYEQHYMPLVIATSFGSTVEEVSTRFPTRVNLMKSLDYYGHIPATYYIQNLNDFFHKENHLTPFINHLNRSGVDQSMVDFILFNGEKTHSPRGFEEFFSLVARIYSSMDKDRKRS